MGTGKTQSSTSQVTIPPEVLAQYQSVNARAEQVAQTPFQTYGGQFVAPFTGQENTGVGNINAFATAAQPNYAKAQGTLGAAQAASTPYYSTAAGNLSSALNAGTAANSTAMGTTEGALAAAEPYNAQASGLAVQGGQAVDPTALNSNAIMQYMNPYLSTVLGSTAAVLNQNNQQQQAGQLGNAITSGAFGGDRAGIAAANLEEQQNLANANIYSGIASNAYDNALATAQGQQQLGLSAAQANRAAVQNEATQLQGIGQQGFEQGLGAAGQEAAIGQQQYEQGTGTGQAQAGLGQAVYGTGANTAAEQAQIAGAAQTSGLEGAQAQLGAGQLQQQTNQAQDTALYNQFLQQQSYPFQVSQFLANIAEGTGALSGSTTTTTQPGGFFSDERLKEDIEPIGKTFDGQTIVKYRYKGEGAFRIGLIAQDVEKKHPDAVGESQGFKTVDYGKATEKSAERGKFAFGGQPTLPGMSQYDLANLLEAQAQMYAPYGGQGLYGAAASAPPHGGSSYVPAGNLPVSHLAVAQPPRNTTPGTLGQIKQIADLAGDARPLEKGLGALWNHANDNLQPTRNPVLSSGDLPSADISDKDVASLDAANDDMPYASGGFARAKMRYAVGGSPMMDEEDQDEDLPNQPIGPGLNIPNTAPHAKLAVAQPPSQSNSSPFGDILGIAKDVIPFLASGGRTGKDDGGSIDDDGAVYAPIRDPNAPSLIDRLSDPSGRGGGAGNPIWNAFGQAAHAVGSAAQSAANGLGRAVAPVDNALFGPGSPVGDAVSAHQAAAPASAAQPGSKAHQALAEQGLAGEDNQAFRSAVGASQAAPARRPRATASAGFGPAVAPQAPATDPVLAEKATELPEQSSLGAASLSQPSVGPMTDESEGAPAGMHGESGPGILSELESGAQGLGHSFMDKVRSDPAFLPAVLKGIAAMGMYPTVHPGVALAAGLMGGTQGYEERQSQLAHVGATQAEAENLQAAGAQTRLGNSTLYYKLKALNMLVPDPNGELEDPATHLRYSPKQGGAGGAPGAPAAAAGQPRYLGQAGQALVQNGDPGYGRAISGMAPGAQELSVRTEGDVYHQAQDAAGSLPLLDEQVSSLAANKNPLLNQGAIAPLVQPAIEWFNSAVTDAGQPQLAIKGLADAQIANKLQTGGAFLQSHGMGQESLGALQAALSVNPSMHMTKEAAATLMAQLRVAAVSSLDQKRYLDEIKQGTGGSYLAQNAMAAFGNDHPAGQYNSARDLLARMFASPNYTAMRADLEHPGTPEYQRAVQTLDGIGQKYGVANFSRFMTGAD